MSALGFAAAFGAAQGIPVEVVSVVEPLSDLPMPLPHREELESANARAVAARVRQLIRDTVGSVDWPVHVRLGRPAPAICTTARSRGARMVVLGVDASRGEGNSVAVELLHLAEKTVLVAHGPGMPRVAVVGVDFRSSSLRAAEEAVRLVGSDGVIHLVHVRPPLDFPAASVWDWGRCYECAVAGAFDSLADALARVGAGEIRHQCRSGDPADELMTVATEVKADLLAIGSDGYICNGRVIVGRVARNVLANAPISVLATPVATTLDGTFAELAPDAQSEEAPVPAS